ncbi:PREDICTED: uncharacterized protein LOC109462535 isoform X1 [Branchiostoma belcheri]|uniref:Uncharacterized protein LOC109462535 isoform X1 n=1 Tax=Branchiostoma belcheri TaxID=7741 RepID=A0A6P4Y7B4_BRABE|nr:PREDICTED: uncharacterized protein LOC109462535 isoform X1 [Branchiostoma belcheri]XP_019614647.1 PREDICTED: uncharacterized protein LOC109462535 isoform X1 [Branchiostoma belcheri]
MWTLAVSVVIACCVLSNCVSSQTLCQSLTADSGSFGSQNYPNNYPNNHDCRYEISVSPPKVIKLTFTDFQVEEDFDYVYVYDGNTTDSTYLIAELTGARIPGPVTSTGSFMTVRLVTDSEVNRKGFQASYAAENKILANCDVGQYRCADGVTCIDAWKRCDGNNDCRDGSDEDATNCTCQLIPSSLTKCRGLHYQRMTLPNPLNFDHTTVTQVENSAGFSDLMTLTESDCHPRVRDLVCATIVPRCESSPNLRQQLPCRSWCEEVKYSCENESAWTAFPSCEIFPHTNCNNIMASQTPEGEECFDGNGANYRGDEARGPVAGVDCERWDSDPIYIEQYPWANLVDNKCRNPDGGTRPWCITPGGFEYCDIIPCNAKGCEDPGKPKFGKRTPVLKFYFPGDRITYSCDAGYKFKEYTPARPNNIQCVVMNETTGDADWETPKPDCEVDQKFKLQKDKLNENVYNKAASPTRSLEIKAYVVNVINLNEQDEQIVTAFKAEYAWIDNRLQWEPKEYGHLNRIFVLDDQIWKPTLTLKRNADTDYKGEFPKTEVKMDHTGEVTWPVELLTTTTCTLDPFLFPQDNLTCAVCWSAGEEYTIDCSSSTTHKDRNFLTCQNNEADIETGEWSGKTTLSAANNTACLTMRLKRDPTYHYSTTISPCLILIILMIITFIMPIDKGDRIGFGVTLLLSMVVSLVVVTSFLPVSNSLPFIALLIIVCMALMALFMLTTLFIIIIHDKKGPVPKWVRTVFLKHVARALLMGDLTKNLKDEKTTKYTIRKNATDIEGHNNDAMKMDDDGSPSGGDDPPIVVIRPGMQNEVAATLGGLQGSVDDLKVSVRQLSGSIDALAKASGGGDDDEEVGEYALFASVLDRLSLVLYVIAIVVAIPCTLLIGRPRISPD